MSTLPRTKSLSGADTSTFTRNFKKQERNRPSSLCEASWNRIDIPGGDYQEKLRRTPSQANNLCTTVPTCIVNKTLGGRHTPTRNSLRHSRMAVMARTAKGGAQHRWTNHKESNRVTALLIASYMGVGAIGSLLAIWLLIWMPFLSFKEVPHYASGAIIVSGIITAILVCLPKHQKRIAKTLKILLLLLLLVSVLSCSSVCVFDVLHLINLAPMECQFRNEVIVTPSRESFIVEPSASPSGASGFSFTRTTNAFEKLKAADNRTYKEEEEEVGSGDTTDDEEEYPLYEEFVEKKSPISTAPSSDTLTNITVCACVKHEQGFRIVMNYPNVSCEDVKNVLPIFLVASCILTIVGGVLSAVIIYILWTSRNRFSQSLRPSETKPFIYKSNFKSTQTNKPLNNITPTNGSHLYR